MIEKIREELNSKLSEKRFSHTVGVAETAVSLAEIFGGDTKKVYIAGLLHDMAKELTLEEMNNLTQDVEIDSYVRTSKALLHSAAGAILAKQVFDIDDEIYNAIFYHTTGRENMTLTEKIIFVSDMAEPSRKFTGIEKLREIMLTDIDEAVITAADLTLSYLIENRKNIYPLTVISRNYIIKQKNSGNSDKSVVK